MATSTMPITQARVNLGSVIRRVLKGERITLEKGGIPVATIINREDLEDLEDALELMQLREKQKGERGVELEKFLKRHGF
ncbi:MAG: hypothetical protein G01um10148_8 [Parcubacteria group bacterium Gr01-1014_8]|nr:MAG: hypothetical protein G01um10148_8 [Parcubacteria group bacterium Gr01-1014_8]